MEYGLLIAKEPLFWIFRVWKIRSFLSQKIGGNMIFTDYWKVIALNFSGGGKYSLSLRQRFNGKMIFTDCWKVLVLKFSGMGNTVFFWGKKFMERWYFLITEKFLFWATEKFLFWTFLWWEIFTWSFSAFHDLRNTVFRAAFLLTLSPTIYFQPKITHIVRDKELVLFNGDQDCDKVS